MTYGPLVLEIVKTGNVGSHLLLLGLPPPMPLAWAPPANAYAAQGYPPHGGPHPLLRAPAITVGIDL